MKIAPSSQDTQTQRHRDRTKNAQTIFQILYGSEKKYMKLIKGNSDQSARKYGDT